MADLQSVTYGGTTYTIPAGGDHVELTQAEYDALTQEEKNNGTVYFITDGQSEGGSAARNYTTTERKVGTYLGKDLYEITYTDITVPAYDPSRMMDRQGMFLFNTLGFNDSWTIVNWEGVAQMGNTAIMCPLPMAYATRYEDARSPKSEARAVGIFKFADGWTLYNTDVQPYTCKGLTLRYVKEVL